MQLSPLEIILISFGSALLGAIIGAFLQARFSMGIAVKEARRVAGAKLRAAFNPQMSEYTLLGREIGRELFMNLLNHAAAIEEYRVYVPRKNRIAYQQAWERYYKSLKLGKEGSRSNIPYEDSNIYIERIKEILKFAKPT